jgi:hypothetical protein
MCPDVNLEQLGASPFNGKVVDNASSQHTIANENDPSIPQDAATPSSGVGEDDTTFDSVTYTVKEVTLESDRDSFFGKSSQLMLVKTALDFKNEFLGQKPDCLVTAQTKRPEFWNIPSVRFFQFFFENQRL